MSGDLPYRPAVGIMLLDARGKVFVGQRLDSTLEAWQMPQGGLDPGEDAEAGALRELSEETGIDPRHVIMLDRTADELTYDLPPDLVGKLWKGRWRGQRQTWFLARFTGTDADVNIATPEPEFRAWKWADAHELPAMIVPFKQRLYRQVLACFQSHLPSQPFPASGGSMSIHQLIVPTFTQQLQALSAQIDKAVDQALATGIDPETLLAARIAPDMFPLAEQIRFACTQAGEALAWLTEGTAGDRPAAVADLAEAKALIARTLDMLAEADPARLDAAADRPIALILPNGMTFDLSGNAYVRDWALPQFYFHLIAAYALLRQQGAPIGKIDYCAHMLKYLREPASAPAS